MMTINCDIGERGADHPVDLALMKEIQIVNLACGGHAGNRESIAVFRDLAEQYKAEIAAHLSYPDPENFGRVSMNLSCRELYNSLDQQIERLPGVQQVKFHGALYNDAAVDSSLAEALTKWLQKHKIQRVITGPDSALSESCKKAGIQVIREFFAERRYTLAPDAKQLTLVSRKKSYASITDVREALSQCQKMVEKGVVQVWEEQENGELTSDEKGISADTICIHSDSEIALTLASDLRRYLSSLVNT